MSEYTREGFYLPNRADALEVDVSLADNFRKLQELLDDIRIHADSYNAISDGTGDATTALQNAISNTPEGGTLELKRNGIYNTSANLVGTKNIRINGNGAKITASHASAIALKLEGTLKYSTTALAYASDSGFIELNSVVGLEVGDQLRVYHTSELYDTSRSYFYKGGSVLVVKIEGAKVWISSKFPYSIGTGATVDVYKPITVEVNDLEIVHTGTLGTSPYGSYGLNIRFSKYSKVNNVKVDNYNHNVKMDNTVNCLLTGIETGRAYWSSGGECYGVSNYSGNGLLIMNSSLMSGRHGYTTTGQETTYGTTLINCHVGQEPNVDLAGLDCHGNNFSLVAINCHVYRFNLHGNCSLIDCTLYDNEVGDKSSFAPAETRGRANFRLLNCNVIGGHLFGMNAYGQVATTSRKYIGSIVFENCSGDGLKNVNLDSLTSGGSVRTEIERVVVKNAREFIVQYTDVVENVHIENVKTTGSYIFLNQISTGGLTKKAKIIGCTIPSRYRCITLINFTQLVVEDCDFNPTDTTAGSFLLNSTGGEVIIRGTHLTSAQIGRGIETSGFSIFTTSESSAVQWFSTNKTLVGTARRADYVAI